MSSRGYCLRRQWPTVVGKIADFVLMLLVELYSYIRVLILERSFAPGIS